MDNLYELIIKCKNNDNESFEIICKKFEPLILKYSRLLNYEDAYCELKDRFILCIYKMPIEENSFKNNETTILSYIKTTIKNEYINLNKRYEKTVKNQYSYEELSTELTDYSYKRDFQNLLTLIDLRSFLNRYEFKLLYLKYYLNYTDSEIAKHYKISRQAVNKKLHKIINKLYTNGQF